MKCKKTTGIATTNRQGGKIEHISVSIIAQGESNGI